MVAYWHIDGWNDYLHGAVPEWAHDLLALALHLTKDDGSGPITGAPIVRGVFKAERQMAKRQPASKRQLREATDLIVYAILRAPAA